MSKAPKMGRASMFRGKTNGYRVQAIITQVGGIRFERARVDLATLYRGVVGAPPPSVSDADVVEYLARGPQDTRRYLQSARKGK